VPLLLALETSCDETAAAVVRDGAILSSVVSSQAKLHAPYGGVVPEVASREHLRVVDAILLEALGKAGGEASALEAVAVTRGPGLPSALLVGVAAARGLALRLGKPLVPVHHVEAHLYSAPVEAPFVALVVSGGHTMLVHVESVGKHRLLGQTVDDAAGEAFDKAAQLLGLGYPGGPAIEKAARKGNPKAYDFPRPMLDSDDWNFSFSGLKTALRRAVQQTRGAPPPSAAPSSGSASSSASEGEGIPPKTFGAPSEPSAPLPGSAPPIGNRQSEIGNAAASALPIRKQKSEIANLSASFQAAVVETLVGKTLRAARKLGARGISVSGGVACNGALKAAFEKACRRERLALGWAERDLCTDNAAMIGLLAERKLRAGAPIPASWDIAPDWALPISDF
jgi:N6-L-threonylcarbamoyladenine synthase